MTHNSGFGFVRRSWMFLFRFSEKLEIRRVNPENPASHWGVFATDHIDAKEDLFHIPRDCYINVFDPLDMTQEDWKEPYHKNVCNLTHRLKDEMELGEKSEYAPYISYLKTQKPGQLPANWSKEGKDVLRHVAIPNSPMVDWIDWYFQQTNCIGDDPYEVHLLEMTIQRCFDTALIPIWDMVNHDNGRINTEDDSMHLEDGLRVRAKRDLAAGEEIFASYDLCKDCFDLEDYVGTPEILKDFGFVENYPHRWVFMEPYTWIEIHEGKGSDNNEGQKLLYFGEEYGQEPLAIQEDQVLYLRNELDRLKKVGAAVLQHQGSVPDHEWRVILQFYDAAVADLSTVLEYLDNNEQSARSSIVLPRVTLGEL
eukprot:jgi/Psemu1/327878/estExt_fgenesh1_pg.C_8750001